MLLATGIAPASDAYFRDSIPYSEVFYNGIFLKRFYENQKDFNLRLNTRQLRSSDIITITYFEDVVNSDCNDNLQIRDKSGRLVKVIMIDEAIFNNQYQIEVKELFRLVSKYDSKELSFSVRYGQFTPQKFLFKLHLN